MPGRTQIRDPVHNFIELTEEEVRLIETPLLQRLRRIRQLAMASLVYPGAVHTRFEHTLGVCHVAGLMAKQLDLPDDERRLVRLAALLHDVGHGPFSHVSENVLLRFASAESIPADHKKEKIHELITERLICKDKDIARIVGADMASRIARLLRMGHGPSVLRSIVSGPLDADKQDYLLRDSQYCGVRYGIFDAHQLHRSMVKVGPEDDQELMIDPDGVHALEQFVLAKYFLTTNVYRHRVRLVSDQMIVRALMLGVEVDEIKALQRLFSFDGSDEYLGRFIEYDDSRLMIEFGGARNSHALCGRLLSALEQRNLHKRIFSSRIEDFSDPAVKKSLQDVSTPDQAPLRASLETAVAELVGRQTSADVDPRLVIVHGFDIKSVRTSSRNDEASIMINRTPPKPFEEDSTLFASINEGYADGFVEVYAPVSWDTAAERRRLLRELEQPIREAIETTTKSTLPQGDA